MEKIKNNYAKSFTKGIIVGILLTIPTVFAADTITYQRELTYPERIERLLNEIVPPLAKKYGTSAAIALKIIKCESRNIVNAIHKNTNGTVDKGLMQINSIHNERAKQLGFDLNVPSESLEYGMLLLGEQGTKPWGASKSCWI